MRWTLIALAVVSLTSVARADAIGGDLACPPGARAYRSHSGQGCLPWPCESDDECARGGGRCREYRVCTTPVMVRSGGGRRGPDEPAPPPREVLFVTGTCETAARCRGDEEAPPVGVRPGQGAIRCEERRYCVPEALPALVRPPSRDNVGPPMTSTSERAESAPREAAPPNTAPVTRGCACSTAPGLPAPLTLAVVLALLVFTRRARWLTLGVLAAGAPTLATAQAPGWSLQQHPGGIEQPWGIACAGERAWVRNREPTASPAVVSWDGQIWSVLPPLPLSGLGHWGGAIGASREGVVYVLTRRSLFRHENGQWRELDVTGFGQLPDGAPAFHVIDDREIYVGDTARIGAVVGARLVPFDAGTWRRIVSFASAGSLLWAGVDGGQVMEHDGRAWTRRTIPGELGEVRALFAAGERELWAAGSQVGIARWNGSEWAVVNEGLTTSSIRALGGAAPDHVYAGGTQRIWRWNGRQWQEEVGRDAFTDYATITAICATDFAVLALDDRGGLWTKAR